MIDPGITLQNFRRLHKFTQKDIAKFMCVTPATVGTWEREQCKVTFENFQTVMDFLGYEIVIRKKNADWKDSKPHNYDVMKEDNDGLHKQIKILPKM